MGADSGAGGSATNGGANAGGNSSAGASNGETNGAPSTTSGCGTSLGNLEDTIDVDGDPRSYVLAVPSGHDANVAYPIVFAFHGRGGSGTLASMYFGVEGASAGAAIVVYPDATVDPSDGQAQLGYFGARLNADVAFFDALLDRLTTELGIDSARVFATGHSSGGYVTNSLG